MKNPQISVCIPTFNGEIYLAQAIESVLQQSFQDFELLIVDDCSKDSTLRIAYGFSQKDSRVKVFENSLNLGLVENWNQCIQLAGGVWIKYLFQDDFLEPDCLGNMLEAAGNQNLVIANRKYVFETGIHVSEQSEYLQFENALSFAKLYQKPTIEANAFSTLFIQYPAINIWGEPSSIMVKKEAFEKYGDFTKSLSQTADLELLTRIGTNEGAALIHNCLINFRIHSKSTTKSNHAEKGFHVHYRDFFEFIHLVLFDSKYQKFRKTTKFKLAIIYYKLAKHVQDLREWKGMKSVEEEILMKEYPEFIRFFKQPNYQLAKSGFMAAIQFPSQFLKKIGN